MKRILMILSLLLAFPGSAQAWTATFSTEFSNTSGYPAFDYGITVAAKHFGSPGHCTSIGFGTAVLNLTAGDEPGLPGVAFGTDCHVWLTAEIKTVSDAWLCTVAEHEFGHASLDLPHSPDPDDLMAETINAITPECREVWSDLETTVLNRAPVQSAAQAQAHRAAEARNRRWCRNNRTRCAHRRSALYGRTFGL